ncbi:hypothetical protein H0A65_01450 [Alcaligenaceae bacterium]|nr:hypothetical protein [Alcaligenaceae bacterium]
MQTRILTIFVATLLLAGCSSVDLSEPPGSNAASHGCDASKASHVTGKHISPAQEQEAMRSSGAATLRVIRPGQAITRDYRAERLNLQLNDYGTVVRAYCG